MIPTPIPRMHDPDARPRALARDFNPGLNDPGVYDPIPHMHDPDPHPPDA